MDKVVGEAAGQQVGRAGEAAGLRLDKVGEAAGLRLDKVAALEVGRAADLLEPLQTAAVVAEKLCMGMQMYVSECACVCVIY